MTKQESDMGRFVWVMIGCLFVCLFVCLACCLFVRNTVFSFRLMCAVSAVCVVSHVVTKESDFVAF